jgi:hypothetical protein
MTFLSHRVATLLTSLADYIQTGTKRFCSEVAMPNH